MSIALPPTHKETHKMKHIGLIGCSKSKLRQNDAPDKLFRAEDIYQGKTFLKSKNEGLARFGCESGRSGNNGIDTNVAGHI